MKRRASRFNTAWRPYLLRAACTRGEFTLHHALILPAVGFVSPEYTDNIDGLRALRIPVAIRIRGMAESVHLSPASSSEPYGLVLETAQHETTPFFPRSAYGAAKLFAYWITVNARESYCLFACNGILFNHETTGRGETLVTRKITRDLAYIRQPLQQEPDHRLLHAHRRGHLPDHQCRNYPGRRTTSKLSAEAAN